MVKMERSSAPLGLALLFLSLAIVPVSLRIAGYDVNVSPSLSAAVEAWRNIAGVLGTSSQSSSETELSLAKKYSFAPETTASEAPVATEPCVERFEADFEPNLEAAWSASEAAAASLSAPVAQSTARATLARASVACRRVGLDRLQRTIASALPALVRTAARAEAKTAKCGEGEAGVLRVRELPVLLSRALSESLKTALLQEDMEVFLELKPIALVEETMTMPCGGEQSPPPEAATDLLRNAVRRFGVGASEEPESFEFWFEF